MMNTLKRGLSLAGLLLGLLALLSGCASHPTATQTDSRLGVLVVTPDRGFLGNEEVRDAFARFASKHKAQLLFVTDGRSEAVLDDRLATLRQQGVSQFVVLPLVVSVADARWQLAQGWLSSRHQSGEQWVTAKPYGSSYLAVEDLSARLAQAHADANRLLLVGYGAGDAAGAATMAQDMTHLASKASSLPPDAISAVVWPSQDATDGKQLQQQVMQALASASHTLLVPLAFAPRADEMMDFANWFGRDLPAGSHKLTSPIASTDALVQWLELASNQAELTLRPVSASDVGVIVLTHGADWFWNQAIEQSLAPVAERYKVAYAFSMADQPVIERALRQLERQDVRAIVLVRAFSMSDSFLPPIERMLGLNVAAASHQMHLGGKAHKDEHAMEGHDMGGHGMDAASSLAAPARIRSALPIVTVGGVEASPLFARALLANARAVAKQPQKETVIVVAHGQGSDDGNARWLSLLDNLAGQMRAEGGDQFRAIRVATWREDWPDKRKQAVAQVRQMVQDASKDGGRTLIVPARINGQGAAGSYLAGLDFGWSQGFAQTPFFAQWVEQEITQGLDQLNAASH